MSSRVACGACGSTDLHKFLDLGATPLADAFPASADEKETFHPLGLLVCHQCWLVQNTEVVPDDLLYNDHYGFYTGASPSSIAYFLDYADWAIKRFAPGFVVEIASNDGTLLNHFNNGLGVEPSANVAAASPVPTYVAPFGRSVAADIASIYRKPDLIIANNVVAHVSDLDDFLGGIADLLAADGTALIEFQYVADLLLGNQFDHVYHEHRSFFSVSSLDRALTMHGLYVSDWQHTPAQGGSVRAVVRHGRRGHGWGEAWLEWPDAYAGTQGRIDHLRDRLVELVYERQDDGPVVAYGATAKSTTLLNYCDLGDLISYVEDLTPYKIGRFSPGTRIPIRAPQDERPPTYLLTAWNYLSGVLRRERAYIGEGGRFIVPIPAPVLL